MSSMTMHYMLTKGLHHQFNKRLSNISLPDNRDGAVTAYFEDNTSVTGNLLVGADGANSYVRSFLFGPEKAALHHLPLMGCVTVATIPGELATKIRTEYNNIYILNIAPVGLIAFISRTYASISSPILPLAS